MSSYIYVLVTLLSYFQQMSEQITGNYAVTLPAYGYSQQTTNGGSLQASYGASEGSYVYQQASAPVYQQSYYQPSPPVYQRPPLYTPAATLPAAPVFGSAPLINNQVDTAQLNRRLSSLSAFGEDGNFTE